MAESPVEDYCVQTLAALSDQALPDAADALKEENLLDSYRDFGGWVESRVSSLPPSRASARTEADPGAMPKHLQGVKSAGRSPPATPSRKASKSSVNLKPQFSAYLPKPIRRKQSSATFDRSPKEPVRPPKTLFGRLAEPIRSPHTLILSATGCVPLNPITASDVWQKKKRLSLYGSSKETVRLRRKGGAPKPQRTVDAEGDYSPPTPLLYQHTAKLGPEVTLADLIRRRLSLYPGLHTAGSPALQRPKSEKRLLRPSR